MGWILFPLTVSDILTSMFYGYDFIWERWPANSFQWYCGLNVTPPSQGSGIRTHVHHGRGGWGSCGTYRGGDLWRSSHKSWALRLYGLTALLVFSLILGYGHNATSHLLVPIAISSRSTACVFPALVDGSPLELWAKITLFFLKLPLLGYFTQQHKNSLI